VKIDKRSSTYTHSLHDIVWFELIKAFSSAIVNSGDDTCGEHNVAELSRVRRGTFDAEERQETLLLRRS
jgi:hypothetical protein